MKEIEVKKRLPIILMNFNEVKSSLEDTMDKYRGVIVTEENLKKCKTTQKDLAKLRRGIDEYRKNVKREMEKPIKEFEFKCKDLINLITEVEKPIKDGIKIYDDKRRDEKRSIAKEYIKESIKNYNLNEEYAAKLTVKDKYLNLSGTLKSIKEDIDMQANILKKEQENERDRKNIYRISMKSAIDSVNKKLNTKLELEDFEEYLELDWPLDRVLKEIENRAEAIFKAENKAYDIKNDVQVPLSVNQNIISNYKNKLTKEDNKYFVDIHVSHNYEMIKALSQFLKENGYEYEVYKKGRVK
ncbi:DUF1351 domain-containing protein [Clostridium baratii]|uniref:Protein of uncharacterized function (DUF1351) n=1 Tax=Clostridium baratii TaxID=1561 RepID=A0A174PLG1_9CLOT|nr:DUF1351 domain-containing protein [Clostridium baratii]CUP61823.1 Protein of uncharacterised function (DUF1351) [Clostridium baratii]